MHRANTSAPAQEMVVTADFGKHLPGLLMV